jgi:hypothetical protein
MAKLFDGCPWLVGFEEIVNIADCLIGTLVQSLTQLPEQGVSVLPKPRKGQPDDHWPQPQGGRVTYASWARMFFATNNLGLIFQQGGYQ